MAIDNFGIPNVDTRTPEYDPEKQFHLRFDRLQELITEDTLFAGDIHGYITSLATFTMSALRSGIDMARRDKEPIESILTTSGLDIIQNALYVALTNPEVRRSIVISEQMQQKRLKGAEKEQ